MGLGGRLFVAIGAALAALAVMLGAFGAHALKTRLTTDMMDVYHTAVQYHFWHALGVLAIGLVLHQMPDTGWLRAAGWLLTGGTVLFSGSLYLLAFTGQRWLGVVTPVGGLALILGWLALMLAALRA